MTFSAQHAKLMVAALCCEDAFFSAGSWPELKGRQLELNSCLSWKENQSESAEYLRLG